MSSAHRTAAPLLLSLQWSYFEYSTYTRMEYRVKKASDGSIVTTGSIASSEISKTPTPTSRESGLLLTGLSGRFTVEVRLASDYGTSAYSPPSDVVAAGAQGGLGWEVTAAPAGGARSACTDPKVPFPGLLPT